MRAPRWMAIALITLGCAGARPVPRAVSDLDRMMTSPAAREVAREAPDAFAEVVAAVRRAREMRGDAARVEEAAAEARIEFERAQHVAGLGLARRRIESAERQRAEVDADVARIEQETQEIQAEATRTMEARRASVRARQVANAPASVAAPERRAAAAELRQQAGLFVAAAVMLGADAQRVTSARERIAAAGRVAGGDANAALLAAGGAYAEAERLLQTAREGHEAVTATDGATLETALSEAGGFDPRRDARGVIAVMRGLFEGPRLSPASQQRVATLARVIRAHADARVRVEVFVGGPARAPAEALATAQAEALAAALRRGGVPQERLQAQGLHRAPGSGARDDRVEVVLVLPTSP